MRTIKELLKLHEWQMTDEEYDFLEAWKEERRREEREYEEEERGYADYKAYDEYESRSVVFNY